MPRTHDEEPRRTTETTRIPVVDSLQPCCELVTRACDCIEVVLLWDRRTDELRVCVRDTRTGERFELAAGRDDALEVFHHSYAYAAARAAADGRYAPFVEAEQPPELAP